MEEFIKSLEEIATAIPLAKILIAIGVLIVGKICQGLFSRIIIGKIERWTEGTETDLDDRFIAALKMPLNWAIILLSIWVVQLMVSPHLTSELNDNIGKAISVGFVFILCYFIFTAAPVLGDILALLTLQTETDLDDLLVPYMPKVFQTIAVMLFLIKASETFLGTSAGALIGILGGAGVAMGLLFKDIIYDWCCAIIIYTDGLYRPGDWLSVDGMSGFIQVIDVGLRSTKLRSVDWGTIKKIPNSQMISGILENWSQSDGKDLEWGLCSEVKIDGISAKQTARIADTIESFINSLESCSGVLIRFSNIEGNTRVIKIRFYVNDANLYFAHERTLHLGILDILDKEGVEHLSVFLRTDPFKLDKTEGSISN